MKNSSRWRFGPFEADAAEHTLLRDGAPVPISRKSFALLATLLSRPGHLFTKAELFDTVWTGTVVSDAALSRAIHGLRVALGDDAAAPRYVATAHGIGFRFVALASPAGSGSPAGTAPSTGQCLVGREAELAELDRALAEVRAGKRKVVFVTGEAGIGKTALVEAFVRKHVDRGELWAAQGRCIEQYGAGEAHLPILEALEGLARQVGDNRFRDALARYAPTWLALLPWLAHDADPALLQRSLADATAQRMLREIAQALEVLAEEHAIVLWLEDLHWSDPSSLAVVSFLAGRREPAKLLLVATFRPADAQATNASLHRLTLKLLQRGQASELEVDLLDKAAVATYLRNRFSDSAAVGFDDLAAVLHRRTDGNALFTVAMVDDLVHRRALTQDDGVWTLKRNVAALDARLPDSLRDLVHELIDHLTDSDRRLIEAAAVAGNEFSVAMVAAALQAEVGETEDRCARLARQGRFLRACTAVSWPDGSVASGFGFLHALYWQAAFERVPEGRLADWQRRIGSAQEQAYGAQCGSIAAELAMRFEAAHDIERSLRFLQLAGTNALARCAYRECIAHLRHALELLPRLSADRRPRGELDLLLPLGAALMAVQGYASEEVEATYQRALLLCRACGNPGELERALRGLWNVLFSRAELGPARAAAAEILEHANAGENPGLLFDALGKLGHTCMHLGDFADARGYLERALALPEPSDDPTWLREAPRLLACLSWVLWFLGHPAKALACAEQAMARAGRATAAHSSAYALGYTSLLHGLRGEWEAALDLARQLSALSAEYGLEYWHICAELAQGWAEAMLGDPRAGAATLEHANERFRALGTIVGLSSTLCVLAEVELAAGNADRASAALMASSDLQRNDGHVRSAAEHARLLGDLALATSSGTRGTQLAQRHYLRALEIARRQGARALELRAATSLARLWAGIGEPTRAAELLKPLYESFTEGFDTLDLRRTRQLLDELIQSPNTTPD